MSRYRKVSTRMYADAKWAELSRPAPNGQSLWLYLITGPHTTQVPGLFSVGEAALAEALHWPMPGFRRAFCEIAKLGMAAADWDRRLVWIPKAITHNEPESPSVVKGWHAAIAGLPECDLKRLALKELGSFFRKKGPAWETAWATACRVAPGQPEGQAEGQGVPHQEQEQDVRRTPPPQSQADSHSRRNGDDPILPISRHVDPWRGRR